MKKLVICLLIILMIVGVTVYCYALDEASVISSMNGSSNMTDIGSDTGIGGIVNLIIGLIQIAGTGIALVTVTLLGAKYIISSPEQKAEIKNRAMPVVIGMVILFGAVNMVAIVANLVESTWG